jgi:hypothetical protein
VNGQKPNSILHCPEKLKANFGSLYKSQWLATMPEDSAAIAR